MNTKVATWKGIESSFFVVVAIIGDDKILKKKEKEWKEAAVAFFISSSSSHLEFLCIFASNNGLVHISSARTTCICW